ncbi:unnamed protein product [Boreogadus saida]
MQASGRSCSSTQYWPGCCRMATQVPTARTTRRRALPNGSMGGLPVHLQPLSIVIKLKITQKEDLSLVEFVRKAQTNNRARPKQQVQTVALWFDMSRAVVRGSDSLSHL